VLERFGSDFPRFFADESIKVCQGARVCLHG
jgi:hypothetical protein